MVDQAALGREVDANGGPRYDCRVESGIGGEENSFVCGRMAFRAVAGLVPFMPGMLR